MSEPLVITSMGLNPSNRGAGFPNLARETPCAREVIAAVTDIAEAELVAAGIKATRFGSPLGRGEVPAAVIGQFGLWGFQRAWYYWMASGPGLPIEKAEPLHAAHGRVCRVAGHAGGMDPREWYKGFGVTSYHVDGPEGLKALVDALRSVYDPATDPDSSPRTGG